MHKTYLLGNSGYAQECFAQFVLGGVIKDFGGFLILKNNKLILINEEGVDDFKYPDKSAFVLATRQPVWRNKFLEHLFKIYEKDINHFPNIVSNEAYLAQTSRLGVGNVLNCFAMINANTEIGNFNLLNCYASLHHDVKIGDHNIFATYATALGYNNVGDNNWLDSSATVTQRTNIGNNNTLSSGEHLFDDMNDGQLFQHGLIIENVSKE